MKKLVLLLLLIAGCGYAGSQGYGWVSEQIYQPLSHSSQPIRFHVAQGESPEEVADELQSRGLIRNREVFLLYLRYTQAGSRLQAGDFQLDRDMSMAQIVDVLTGGRPLAVTVRLPEGFTIQKMAEMVQQLGLASAQDYVNAARADGWDYDFLRERPANAPDNLEGFLFPDTYQVTPSEGARGLIRRQLDRFGQAFSLQLRARGAQPAPGRPPQSLWGIVVLASIVEREVNRDPDRAIVCGIFYNRLARGMPLGADATVLYGLGRWQGALTAQDLAKDTPYNTRIHPGLPPGPISNPGLAALTACVNPQPSNYLYYFTDPRGETHYARTQAEFIQQQRQFGVSGT